MSENTKQEFCMSEILTPDTAKELLQDNPDNRPISPELINLYKIDIENGK